MGAGWLSHPTEELVRRGRSGDPSAFVSLIERYRSRLEALAYVKMSAKLLRSYSVEDVLQEACLRGFRSFQSFESRGPNSFFRWISELIEHVIVDLARHEEAKKRAANLVSLDGDGKEHREILEHQGPSPSTLLRREERFERLKKALEGLGEDHREVILLARIQLLPMKEVARRMGRSTDAVSELLRRALLKLKQAFGRTESCGLPMKSLADGDGAQDPQAAPGTDVPDRQDGKRSHGKDGSSPMPDGQSRH
jgi:RNA polymerase sigma-70 factor, ECF subfamily